MKWFAQYFLSPLIAALVAIWGSYQFIQKDELKKEYTKLGVDILLHENAPEPVKTLGIMFLEKNSPVHLSDAEKDARLHDLIRNIPYNGKLESGTTWGDIAARYGVLAEWVGEVANICPECINQNRFNERFVEVKQKLYKDSRIER